MTEQNITTNQISKRAEAWKRKYGTDQPMADETTIETTAEAVRAYREANQCSIFEAREELIKRALLTAIDAAKTLDDLKPILRTLCIGRSE